MKSLLSLRHLAAAAIAAGLAGGAALAQAPDPVAGFYRGRNVTLLIGSSPGGGYDLYGRLIARFIGRHIPGNPQVIVQNMPGAASNVAAAYVYNVAPKDGTVMGAIFMGAVVDPLFGEAKRSTHDTAKFNYIGNANSDAYVCLVRTDAGVNSLSDVFDKEIVMGASAEGASTRDFPSLLKNLLGVKFKIVAGYPGTREINLAIEKGEVQGGCGETWSSVAATYPAWFRDKKLKALVVDGLTRDPLLPEVPTLLELARTDEQKAALLMICGSSEFARSVFLPPGVPQERVDALRRAFDATMKDPEFLAEAEKLQIPIEPNGGEALDKIAKQIVATPAGAITLARKLLGSE